MKLTVSEATEITGLSYSTIYRYLNTLGAEQQENGRITLEKSALLALQERLSGVKHTGKPGRPRNRERRHAVCLRPSDSEYLEWEKCAKQENLTVSQWLMRLAQQEVG